MIYTKEIGSDFKIPLSAIFRNKKNNLPKDILFLSSGRDCLEYLIKYLHLNDKSSVLLPSYLCESILEPFKENKITIKFYKVNEKLEVDLKDFESKIKKGKFSIALIINYFGFMQPNIKVIKKICRKYGVYLIEDKVHSFLSKESSLGDFTFNSYRKIFPTPDGAFLSGTKDQKISLKHSFSHFLFIYTRFVAGILKNISFLKFVYRKLFIYSEKNLIRKYKKPAKMSFISKSILSRLNIGDIINKRRQNYRFLSDKIRNIDDIRILYKSLPKEVCPLGLPILCKSREKIKNLLINNKIFPPIHWELPKEVSKKEFPISWKISNNILTIPVDQRYNRKDMKRIEEVLKNA